MLFLSTAFCLAQDMNHTMYVYRNDGGFDAFLFSDIDSITYSKIGTDGYEYDNYVVQEICTADSIYRIPLAAIDSVGLVTPPTIINRDVFSLTNAHVPYIVKADTISFVMSKSTPADMLPAKGNIVAAEADCTAFPNGIIARIVDIDETNPGYEFECEKATIDDVYDQIVFYGKSENESESDTTGFSMMAPQQISDTITGSLWNTDFEHTWNYSGTTTDVKANDMAYWSVKICKTLLRPLTAEIILTNSLTSSISFNAKSEADVSPAPVQIGPTLKVGRITFPHPLLKFIWFEPQISLYGYFEENDTLCAGERVRKQVLGGSGVSYG